MQSQKGQELSKGKREVTWTKAHTQTNNNNKTANTRQNHMACFMFSKDDLEAAKGPQN